MPFSSKKDAITASWILTITASWILTITASWIQLSQHLDFFDTFNYFTIFKCKVLLVCRFKITRLATRRDSQPTLFVSICVNASSIFVGLLSRAGVKECALVHGCVLACVRAVRKKLVCRLM